MSKLVIFTCTLEEARAAQALLERQIDADNLPLLCKTALGFAAKLHKAIQHTEGVKSRV